MDFSAIVDAIKGLLADDGLFGKLFKAFLAFEVISFIL